MFKRINKIKKIAKAATMTIAAVKLIETYGAHVQNKAAKKEVLNNSKLIQAKAVREKFDQIVIGDLTNNGAGGSSKDEVIALLGEPDMITDSTIQDIDVEVATWRRNLVVVTVQFEEERAISKNITGFKWLDRPKKLTLEVFNNLETGSSYADIIDLIGEPDGVNESKINDCNHITAIWRTGLSGERGASAVFIFKDGKLVNKSQAHLV